MTIQQKIIKNKTGLLSLAEELQNVSKACKIMGFSRDTFYRYKELVDEGGMENLVDKTRKKPNLKNRIDEAVYLMLKQEVIESKVVNADESPHRMLERNEGNYTWYLWCFCTRMSVYFEIHNTRAGSVRSSRSFYNLTTLARFFPLDEESF